MQALKRTGLISLIAILLAVFAMGGCTVRLFPEHEPAIIDGLKELNSKGLTFFESLACIPKEGAKASFTVMAGDCVKAAEYNKRKPTYDGLIGQAQSVIQLVVTRPEPKSFLSRFFGTSSEEGARTAVSSPDTSSQDDPQKASRVTKEDAKKALLKAFDAPTDDALETLIGNLKRMRDTDRKKGLKVGAAIGHQRLFVLSMRNALTFEMALNR